jgi:Fusaric acid resistance protein family
MLSITNEMTYDASQFWNTSIGILGGIAVGAVAILILPPLSPAIRTGRLGIDARRSQAPCDASVVTKAG